MELGIDIADLNVVHMRNVPPSSANYAQRSDRAGRNGQPAFVTVYCTMGSGHDQYFFRRPERMVAGCRTRPSLCYPTTRLIPTSTTQMPALASSAMAVSTTSPKSKPKTSACAATCATWATG